MRIDLETGAREGIERICEAYGFTSRNQLARHLGITNSSLGSRILRNNFPSDIALRCSLETGASLLWLVTGDGAMFDHASSDIVRIPSFKFDNSKLVKTSSLMFDKVMIPDHTGDLEIIVEGNAKYLVDKANYAAAEGKYLIEYSGTQSIKELSLLPGNKLRIDWGKYPLDCEIDDVTILGKVIMTMVVSA